MTTVGEWLASRTPPPPKLLRARITDALGSALHENIRDTERVCLAAAERVLDGLLADSGAERSKAADLLAADALVTYALEWAADAPERFAQHATLAIDRFSRLQDGG